MNIQISHLVRVKSARSLPGPVAPPPSEPIPDPPFDPPPQPQALRLPQTPEPAPAPAPAIEAQVSEPSPRLLTPLPSEDAPERFQSFSQAFFGRPLGHDLAPRVNDAWKQALGSTPEFFMDALFRTDRVDLGGGVLDVDLRGSKVVGLAYDVMLTDPQTRRPIGTMVREFEFPDSGKPSAWHAFLELQPTHQGRGIAKDLLLNSVEFYERAGIEAVHLKAGLQTGGYAWAKYGFKPSSREEARALFCDVTRRLSSLDVPSGTRRVVEGLLKRGQPEAVWALSDLQVPVTDPHGEATTLGKALLLGTSWRGVLNLKDQAARARFDQYLHKDHAKGGQHE